MNETDLKALRTVKKYTWLSAGAGLIPILMLDGAAVAGLQLKMLADLSKIYGVPFQKNRGKVAIATLGSFTVPHAAAFGAFGGLVTGAFLPVACLVKGIPVVGSVAGAPIMSAFSAAYCWALGNVFLQHFASGGTFLDFDAEKVKEYFKAQYEEGRRKATAPNPEEGTSPA